MRSSPLGPVGSFSAATVIAATASLAVALFAVGPAAAAPASAPRPPSAEYVNLGDSFSAGWGTGVDPFDAGCIQGAGPDHVSKLASMARVELLANAACGGMTAEVLAAMVERGDLDGALSRADLVTLTIGGNDLNVGALLLACSPATAPTCAPALQQAVALTQRAGANAGNAVGLVDAAAGGDAQILVLGYPHLFAPAGVPGVVDASTAAVVNGGVDALNAAIRAGIAGIERAEFVPVAGRFAGHELGTAEPWIALGAPGAPDNLHPTSAGYLEGYLPAVRSNISVGQLAR